MKNFRKLFFVMLIIFTVSAVYAETNFSINLSGNLGYVPNSSMDDAVSWYGDDTAEELNTLNSTDVFKGKNEKAGLGAGIDLEGRLFLNNLGLGLSLGYQYGGESRSVAKAGGYDTEQSLSLTATALSYLGTVYYKYTLAETSYVLLGAGGGYYQGKMQIKEEAKGFASGNGSDEIDFDGSTWGAHLKAEYNYAMDSIGFFGGVMARYASIDEFKKDGAVLTSDGDNIEGNFSGVLLYFGAGLNF